MFRALQPSEAPGSGGRFGLWGECRPKEAVGSGSGTGWEGVAAWIRPFGIDRMTATQPLPLPH